MEIITIVWIISLLVVALATFCIIRHQNNQNEKIRIRLDAINSYINFRIMLNEYELIPLLAFLEKEYGKQIKLGHYEACVKIQHAIEVIEEVQHNYEKEVQDD